MKGLICVAGMYIGWFLFLIQTFDSIADKHAAGNAAVQDNFHDARRSNIQMDNVNNYVDAIVGNVNENLSDNTNDVIRSDAVHLSVNTNFNNEARLIKGAHEKKPLPADESGDESGDELELAKMQTHDEEDVQDAENAGNVEDEGNVQNITPNETSAKCIGLTPSSTKCTLLSNFKFDKARAEKAIQAYDEENNQKIKPLSAYIEEKMKDEIPNTGREPDYNDKKDDGEPNQYIQPLPLRTASSASPGKLRKFEYPKVDSCDNFAAKFPTDAGLLTDESGKMVYPNVQNRLHHIDVMEYAKYCPVDADPFLPWIHDVFPSNDGKMIHFVAQNKRRCNTGRRFKDSLRDLLPQVSIMQPVSVVRVDNSEATKIAPELWIPESDKDGKIDDELGLPRYKLAPYEEAVEGDGDLTRFICRFHTLEYDEDTQSTKEVILGETLSTYPANYEYVNFRKKKGTMMSPKGKDNGQFWLSNLRFDCPVPENGNLQDSIGLGESVFEDGTPSIYVDVVPIRTSPRFGYNNAMFPDKWVGEGFRKKRIKLANSFPHNRTENGFDASVVYGDKHILPRVEASGRWENIPICKPTPPPPLKKDAAISSSSASDPKKKPHTLSACLWASATFHTRGNDRKVTDTMERMKEWLEYHLLSGFDHIYVFDNTGAHTTETNLSEVLDQFPATDVTRIDWPSICCNNNKPGDENPGERSSQYAAESVCRQRYGQYTEWIANIDTDEYLVPMGKYGSMREVVDAAKKEGTNVLSFRSTRAYPNFDFMEEYYNDGECGKKDNPLCLRKRDNATFIETYNCDFHPLPKPTWSDRAKKQIYRPDYVLSHFVHYSTITHDILKTYEQSRISKERWNVFFFERKKSERFTDELNEAVMVHTKTTVPGNTKGYRKTCKFGFEETWKEKCRVGFPISNNKSDANVSRPDGYKHNCYTNDKLTHVLIPKLKEALKKRSKH